jgi:hypothetical protein
MAKKRPTPVEHVPHFVDVLFRLQVSIPKNESNEEFLSRLSIHLIPTTDFGPDILDYDMKEIYVVGTVHPESRALVRPDGGTGRNSEIRFDPPLDEDEDEDEDEDDLEIRYRCPKCGHTWEEEYQSACSSECDKCGTTDIEALMWKSQDDSWTERQEKIWTECDKCECGQCRDHHVMPQEIIKDHPSGGIGGCAKSNCQQYKVDMTKCIL